MEPSKGRKLSRHSKARLNKKLSKEQFQQQNATLPVEVHIPNEVSFDLTRVYIIFNSLLSLFCVDKTTFQDIYAEFTRVMQKIVALQLGPLTLVCCVKLNGT